jgi:hypothetical protein
MKFRYLLIVAIITFSLSLFGATHAQTNNKDEFQQSIVITQPIFQQPLLEEKSAAEDSTLSLPEENPAAENNIKFGYITDAPPVSYTRETKHGEDPIVEGYCAGLKNYLDEYYNSDPSKQVLVEEIQIPNYEERFKHYEGISVECGPNTITRDRISHLSDPNIGGAFSDPFIKTSTKLLIKNEARILLNRNPEKVIIGVIENIDPDAPGKVTTQVIHEVYPTAEIEEVANRGKAIELLNSGLIHAYASDEILLIDLKKELAQPKDYVIEPKIYGFTQDTYGVVAYDEDLLRVIDGWIGGQDKQSRRELERKASYNWISSALRFLVSLDYFYILISCFLFLLAVSLLLLAITNPWLTSPIRQWALLREVLERIKRKRQHKGISRIINVVNNYIFCHVDRDVPIALIEKLAIQPRLERYAASGLSEEEAKERVTEELAQELEKDSVLRSLFKIAIDATTEEFKARIRGGAGWLFDRLPIEKLLGQSKSSS